MQTENNSAVNKCKSFSEKVKNFLKRKDIENGCGYRLCYQCALAALLCCSCLKVDMPAHYTYRLNVSDDLLQLFTVNVQYYDHKDRLINNNLTNGQWQCTVYQLGETAPRGVNVKITAKPQTLEGNYPDKDKFLFYLTPDAEFTPAGRYPIGSKAGSDEVTTFSFRVPFGSRDPNDINLSICPLKYDKHFAFSYSIDDSNETGWSRVFALFNGLWIDDQEFFHFGLEPTTGSKSSPLCVTDGCGNDRRFTFGESIQPSVWDKYNKDGIIQDIITSKYNPYVSWEELQMMTDMGNAVYWHNVDETRWSSDSEDDIISGFAQDYERTLSKIGYPMKTLGQPDGNEVYLNAAFKSPLVCWTRVTGTLPRDICLTDSPSLYKAAVFGGQVNAGFEEKLAELVLQAESDRPILISMLGHQASEEQISFFIKVAHLYGKEGTDNIWVASYDEIYDYTLLRNSAQVSSFVRDGYKYFEVSVPSDENTLHNELSFSISGGEKAEYVSDCLYGFSSIKREDGTVLVNCNFGKRSLELAEKYVALYESTRNTYHKNMSEYLVSLLREDLRNPYIGRIDLVHEPTIEEMPLNGEYTRQQLRDYVKLYNGHSFTITAQK